MAVSLSKAKKLLSACLTSKDFDAPVKILGQLPDGLDPKLVSKVFERLIDSDDALEWVGRSLGRGINPQYVDCLLEQIADKPNWPSVVALKCIRSDSAKERAQQAAELLRKSSQLSVFSMSSSQIAARARTFSSDPLFVEAARAIVTLGALKQGDLRQFAFFQVLLEDGSAESIDALLPTVDAALKSKNATLDLLRKVVKRTKKTSPHLDSLRKLLEATAETRPSLNLREPLAKAIGLATVPKKMKWLWGESQETPPSWSLHFQVNLDAEPSFRIDVRERTTEGRSTAITSQGMKNNSANLPILDDVTEFPQWKGRVAEQLGLRWERSWLAACSLRGAAREQLEAWLTGSS